MYHLPSASTSFTPYWSHNPCCAGNGPGSLHRPIWAKFNNLSMVEPSDLTSQTRGIGAICSTCTCRTTPFSRSFTASSCTWNLGSIWVLLSYPEASLRVVFPEWQALLPVFSESKDLGPHGHSQFSSVAQSCLTFCNPVDFQHTRPPCPSPTLRAAQTHVHCVDDIIQPSHPLFSPSHPTFNLPQHQSLFKGISSSNQVAKVLEFQLQHQSFQWIVRTGFH